MEANKQQQSSDGLEAEHTENIDENANNSDKLLNIKVNNRSNIESVESHNASSQYLDGQVE